MVESGYRVEPTKTEDATHHNPCTKHSSLKFPVLQVPFTNDRQSYWRIDHMEVSWKRGTSKSSILIVFSIINHPFEGTGTTILGSPHIVLLVMGSPISYPHQPPCVFVLVNSPLITTSTPYVMVKSPKKLNKR